VTVKVPGFSQFKDEVIKTIISKNRQDKKLAAKPTKIHPHVDGPKNLVKDKFHKFKIGSHTQFKPIIDSSVINNSVLDEPGASSGYDPADASPVYESKDTTGEQEQLEQKNPYGNSHFAPSPKDSTFVAEEPEIKSLQSIEHEINENSLKILPQKKPKQGSGKIIFRNHEVPSKTHSEYLKKDGQLSAAYENSETNYFKPSLPDPTKIPYTNSREHLRSDKSYEPLETQITKSNKFFQSIYHRHPVAIEAGQPINYRKQFLHPSISNQNFDPEKSEIIHHQPGHSLDELVTYWSPNKEHYYVASLEGIHEQVPSTLLPIGDKSPQEYLKSQIFPGNPSYTVLNTRNQNFKYHRSDENEQELRRDFPGKDADRKYEQLYRLGPKPEDLVNNGSDNIRSIRSHNLESHYSSQTESTQRARAPRGYVYFTDEQQDRTWDKISSQPPETETTKVSKTNRADRNVDNWYWNGSQ